MTYPKHAITALMVCALPAAAMAEIPSWLSGSWQARAQVRAPDGKALRIKCTLEAGEVAANDWRGTLRCASVQGQFKAEWNTIISDGSASGQVSFTKPEKVLLNVSGKQTEAQLRLQASDGQAVAFTNGADGALAVDMDNLGPQHLTGRLSFTAK